MHSMGQWERGDRPDAVVESKLTATFSPTTIIQCKYVLPVLHPVANCMHSCQSTALIQKLVQGVGMSIISLMRRNEHAAGNDVIHR
jgi:hypothetical protein